MTGTGGEISGGGARYYSEPRTHKRHSLDWYVDPPWCTELLLDAEPIKGPIWDPCCGSMTIPAVCHNRGIAAWGSDIEPRVPSVERYDFLAPLSERPLQTARAIVCNPPYGLALQFIERALAIEEASAGLEAQLIAVLVQSKFPYSQRRHRLFTERPPATIYFISTRPSMPPGEKLAAGTLEAKGGKMDYCWMVWSGARRCGPTFAKWLKR